MKALVVKLGGRALGLGLVQELSEAISRFRATGKPTYAWAETFGEFSAGNLPYYLATAFETIYLQPSGDLGLTGLAVERVFLRGTLDKLGVGFEVGARHEFKSAAEQLTEHEFSAPAREATKRMAESVTEQLTAAIAERAKLSPEEAGDRLNNGPYLAGEALAAGLVDALGYRDEVYAAVRRRVQGDRGNRAALPGEVPALPRAGEPAQGGVRAGCKAPGGRGAHPGQRHDQAGQKRPGQSARRRHDDGLGQRQRDAAHRRR